MANDSEKEVKRDLSLQMRVNEEEHRIINEKARKVGLSTSNYMRMVCLHSKLEIAFNPSVHEKE